MLISLPSAPIQWGQTLSTAAAELDPHACPRAAMDIAPCCSSSGSPESPSASPAPTSPESPSEWQVIPDMTPFKAVAPTNWFWGKVDGITGVGAHVTVGGPSGDAKAYGIIEAWRLAFDAVVVGQEVAVRILEVDVEAGTMRLTTRSGPPCCMHCFRVACHCR